MKQRVNVITLGVGDPPHGARRLPSIQATI